MTRILVAGGSRLVGSRLVEQLSQRDDFDVAALVTTSLGKRIDRVDYYDFSDFSEIGANHVSLANLDVFIYLASCVHILNDTAVDPLAAFREIDVGHTLYLARSAAAAGVQKFVFVSSFKLNGEGTLEGDPYKEADVRNPSDLCSISKRVPEDGLRSIAAETGMEVVIIRPVLVYGPGVIANFDSIRKLLQKGVPLSLGAIHYRRSLVGLDNFLDVIQTCVRYPAAANETFLVSVGEGVPATQLLC